MPDFHAFSALGHAVRELLLLVVPFLAAITVHEYAHGLAADQLGDPTPRRSGRLTLNPLAHLDPLGTLALVLTRMIGWAKPVPVDARYFQDPQRGMLLVALAGPLANLLCATAFSGLYKLLISSLGRPLLAVIPWVAREPLLDILVLGVQLNLVLACFNMLPIPPLDGSNVVMGLLPRRLAVSYMRLGRYGMVIVVILALSGVLGRLIGPPVEYGLRLLLS